MKRLILGLAVISLLIITTISYAHGPGYWGMDTGMMGEGQGWNYCPYCGQYLGPRGGYGMGPGMMGGGMMGRSMMGGGMMGPGMMGPGYYQSEECQKFLDETSGLRKELYNKRYEYFEAYRNPKTSPETIVKLEKEIRDIQEKINAKAPRGYSCPW